MTRRRVSNTRTSVFERFSQRQRQRSTYASSSIAFGRHHPTTRPTMTLKRLSLLAQGAALRAASRPGRCRWPAFPLRASPSGPAAAARPAGSTNDDQEDADSRPRPAHRCARRVAAPARRLPWSQYRPCPSSGAGKRPERPSSAARRRRVHRYALAFARPIRLHWTGPGG
jgi:hypothetical protein